MKESAKAAPKSVVLSLEQLLAEQPAAPPPGWIEPGLLPPSGILFVGGEPKVGKSLLVANLALALAAGKDRAGFTIPAARRVLVCQFELPTPQFVGRLAMMRRSLGSAADQNLLVDTRAGGNLLSAPQGLNHFLLAAREAAAEVIVLDPLYSTHDQDENDTRSMAALCQSLLRLRDASKAALIVVHHVRKSIGREEIGSAFRDGRMVLATNLGELVLDLGAARPIRFGVDANKNDDAYLRTGLTAVPSGRLTPSPCPTTPNPESAACCPSACFKRCMSATRKATPSSSKASRRERVKPAMRCRWTRATPDRTSPASTGQPH